MDGQDYLNQISATVRPEKKSKLGSIMGSTIFKVIAGAVVAFIIIAIIGSVINGGKSSNKDQAISLKLNIDSTLKVITKYQSKVKSSILRSSSASLYSVLSNTNRDLTSFINENYNYNSKNDDKKFLDDIAAESAELEASLFEAKINGVLDQVYANEMAYIVSLFYNKEVTLLNATKNENLKSLLTTSANSLNNLYDQFNDFQN